MRRTGTLLLLLLLLLFPYFSGGPRYQEGAVEREGTPRGRLRATAGRLAAGTHLQVWNSTCT